jgi:hypothetical protein
MLGFFLIPIITPYLFVAKTIHITPRSITGLISREIDLERYFLHNREILRSNFLNVQAFQTRP